MTLDEFFDGEQDSRRLFDALQTVVAAIRPTELRISKSQVAFRRRVTFARAWRPSQYLRRPAAPLVLTLSFRHRDPSPRWKSIVEPHPGRFTHHLELYAVEEIDAQVRQWLQQAWEGAA